MNFSVNVDAIYLGKKIDVHDAVEDVAKAGIKNIEFWGWWDKDLDRLCRLKDQVEAYVRINSGFRELRIQFDFHI